jgi:hypothetical protein
MNQHDISLRQLAQLVAASPEGFFSTDQLTRLGKVRATALTSLLDRVCSEGNVGQVGEFLYDPTRLSAQEVRTLSQWFSGSLPPLNKHGKVTGPSIAAQTLKRQRKIEHLGNPAYVRILAALERTPGYAFPEDLYQEMSDERALRELLAREILCEHNGYIYDPLRITSRSLTQLSKRRRRIGKRDQREQLRARLVAAFPAWRHAQRAGQHLWISEGPTNSGKTHRAIAALAAAGSGWYLAPLRLLAFEIFERLNAQDVRCNLLTGEEFIPVPGAHITAATVEMFNPAESGKCVVIDEAFMIADPARGWAWTRALMEARAPQLQAICSPAATNLLRQLAAVANITQTVIPHQRLAPLAMSVHPFSLNGLPPGTILIAFSRALVLQLKMELERQGRLVSIIYGQLPPEVRRRQAQLFADRETDICIATDAVGMGLNLPADRVVFYELEKFDGRERRMLEPGEFHQIAGRAGRFGYSQAGEVGALTDYEQKLAATLFRQRPPLLTHARVAPSAEDLELIPGHLAHKLQHWQALESIPDELRPILKPADMEERTRLATMLQQSEVEQLGLPAALTLINAPARESTEGFWYYCAKAIINGKPMPLPPASDERIRNTAGMSEVENDIACADIYLWLSRRREFQRAAPATEQVTLLRRQAIERLDTALLQKLDTRKQCKDCHRPLQHGYRFNICNPCYRRRRPSFVR